MTLKEQANQALADIKKLLGFGEFPAAPEQAAPDALKDYQTADGSVLKIDKLEAGGTVFAEDGVTPVVAGFTLSDGTIVEVNEAGVITMVTTPVAAAAPAIPAAPAAFSETEEVTEVTEETPAASIDLDAKFAAQEQSFTERIASIEEAHKAEVQKFHEAVKSLLTVMEQFAAEPAGDPIQTPSDAAPAPSKKDRAIALLNAAKANAAAKLNS